MKPYNLSTKESLYLDALRALASQVVLIGHGISFCKIATFLHEPNFPWMQNIAVVVFFVLSGFVITYSTNSKNANGEYDLKSYIIDRGSRIYSALLPALVFIVIIDYINISLNPATYFHYKAFNVETLLANIFMLQDFPYDIFGLTSFGSARILWTIAIEWWIYICFGVIYFAFANRQRITPVIIAIFLWASLLPMARFFDGRGNGLVMVWLYGMAICVIYPYYKKRFSNLNTDLLLFTCALLLCIHRQYVVISGYDKYFALYVSLVIISGLSLSNHLSLDKIRNQIKFLASYSFSLYLIHYSILDFINSNFTLMGKYEKFALGFILSNAIAILMSRYTEIKLTKYTKSKLSKLFKSKSKISIQ